jgi:hypothetical protein
MANEIKLIRNPAAIDTSLQAEHYPDMIRQWAQVWAQRFQVEAGTVDREARTHRRRTRRVLDSIDGLSSE